MLAFTDQSWLAAPPSCMGTHKLTPCCSDSPLAHYVISAAGCPSPHASKASHLTLLGQPFIQQGHEETLKLQSYKGFNFCIDNSKVRQREREKENKNLTRL